MLSMPFNIRSQMESIDRDLGYTWEDRGADNTARIGVNWGMSTERMIENAEPATVISIILFLLVIIITGYLIIYNIFQISVSSDIRYYGLLKTIGVTPRQLKRIVRWQGIALSFLGIPIGLILGYGIGAGLTPFVLRNVNEILTRTTLSISPWIFIFSALFAFMTVLISCMKPMRAASKVSPVEAAKYTEHIEIKRRSKKTGSGGILQMALANIRRSRGKTVIVILSLAFAVVLLNLLYTFVSGFDMEKYLEKQICADFIVSSTDYFRFEQADEYITEEYIHSIANSTKSEKSGCGYCISANNPPFVWMQEERWMKRISSLLSADDGMERYKMKDVRNGKVAEYLNLEGLDPDLFEKLILIDGDIAEAADSGSDSIAIAVESDDYGNPVNIDQYPKVGEKITVTYSEDISYTDMRTGSPADDDTPDEYMKEDIKGTDKEYTVGAQVICPYAMGFRYGNMGYHLILPEEQLKADSRQKTVPLFYMFDAADRNAENEAEKYLSNLTANDQTVMYESKEKTRKDFEGFRNMFIVIGGLLCAVIAVIGALNFLNVLMTSILSRKREFAVIQAVGMTNRQLKRMLIAEGIAYTLGAVILALIISTAAYPLLKGTAEGICWFLKLNYSIIPILAVLPVFLLLGWITPNLLYRNTVSTSIVDRIREV